MAFTIDELKKRKHLSDAIKYGNTLTYYGKIEKIVGMTIESAGPNVNVGEMCLIYPSRSAKLAGNQVKAEVVGIRDEKVLIMPFEDISGIGPGSIVESTGDVLRVPMGDALIGRIIDALGNPIDGKGNIFASGFYPVYSKTANPLTKPRISTKLSMGVKAIDGLLTCGEGQRIGIFSGSGVGKSTLLGMIARNVEADINVIALVGERGREVKEFLERDLGEEGIKRSVMVVATGDQSAMMRLKCAMTATTIAEYFKDRGKKVLLMMDSLTRFTMALRDIGLARGEAPISRGYTPAMYSELPKLLERAGKFDVGSITGIYTVLVEGDDMDEPVSDTVRGIIDGHIILSRDIATRNHYPAIDILGSISRLMNDIVDEKHRKLAGDMRNLLSTYNKNEEIINMGAYKKGANTEIDEAINKIGKINTFLQQGITEKFDYKKAVKLLGDSLKS